MAHQAEHKIAKTGEQLSQTAEDLMDTAASKAKGVAQNVGDYIESAQDKVRDTLRETGENVTEAVNTVSDKVKSTANYVQEQGFSGLLDDVEDLVRRYPIQTLFIGVVLGALIGRSRSR